MKKTTNKSSVPGGVLIYHLIKNILIIGCFTYLSVHFGSVWIVLLALLFTGNLSNGASVEVSVEESTDDTQSVYIGDDWKGRLGGINDEK